MFGMKKDEEKRTKVWRIVMVSSTLVIMLVTVFFLINFFTRNPLEGEWVDETRNYRIEIEDENEFTLEGTFSGVFTEVDLYYTMDKKVRTITIKPIVGSVEEAVEESDYELSPQEMEESLEMFTTSFDYSLEHGTLTLTERESGEQYIFTRRK